MPSEMNVNLRDWIWQLTKKKTRAAYELEPAATPFLAALLALAVKL